MSYTADIADAVVTAINDASVLPSGVDAERVYVPEKDYKDFTGETCKVFAPAVIRNAEATTRRRVAHEVELAIIFAAKLDSDVDPTTSEGNTTIDPLMAIGEAVADAVALGSPYSSAPCIRVEADPIYDFEILRSHRVFVTRLRAFFYHS